MRVGLVTVMAVSLAGSFGAVAETTSKAPDFLKHTYAERPEACAADQYGERKGLQISDRAISGTEFGCTFLNYTPVSWGPGHDINEYVVLVSCGDDSGITRPDHLSIIHSNGELRVQSQNEYVEMVAKEAWNEPGFVSKTYKKCPVQ